MRSQAYFIKKADKNTARRSNTTEVLSRAPGSPVGNMDSWANRPAYERWAEVEAEAKAPKPMSAFSIYHAAYKSRARELCKDATQSRLILAIAASWRAEPEAVKTHYRFMARIDRLNSAITFRAGSHPSTPFSWEESGGSVTASIIFPEHIQCSSSIHNERPYVEQNYLDGNTIDPRALSGHFGLS